MNLLFIGDVVGKAGRRVILHHLPGLRREYTLDVVVANVENAAAGFGITEKIVHELLECGVDIMSNGNHAWDKKEALEFIEREPRLLRPHNYPDGTPGTGWALHTTAAGMRLGVLNIMGTVFMHPTLNDPFRCLDQALAQHAGEADAILLDFHGEATSEKMAMGWYADGRVSAVVGTHTHVPTADERILPGGSGYISDVGMSGCYDSVIGMNKEKSLKRFIQKLPQRSEVADGAASLCAVLITIDDHSGRCSAIERLRIDE